ncbi:unnamed protein product [Strongylus vulgaris]|uniref:Uncharacterized protein n=1 Tax=Strongylus vulgaris TaxID=40348 RepID=A0A3P7IBM6_STRVU|nr:unnamed protein product [Strongylus vulgaris]
MPLICSDPKIGILIGFAAYVILKMCLLKIVGVAPQIAMDWLENALDEYSRTIHPPLVLILCISGSLGHLVSIATLSSMMNPTNAFLISMSW